jgi:steroid 5-alpha reductase family enzyme
MTFTPLNPNLDPFFPEWMAWLGFPHIHIFKEDMGDIILEFNILFMIYCLITWKIQDDRRMKREQEEQQKHKNKQKRKHNR